MNAAVQFLAPIGNRRFEYVFLIELTIALLLTACMQHRSAEEEALDGKQNYEIFAYSFYNQTTIALSFRNDERERFRYPFCISRGIIIVIINGKNYLPP